MPIDLNRKGERDGEYKEKRRVLFRQCERQGVRRACRRVRGEGAVKESLRREKGWVREFEKMK